MLREVPLSAGHAREIDAATTCDVVHPLYQRAVHEVSSRVRSRGGHGRRYGACGRHEKSPLFPRALTCLESL